MNTAYTVWLLNAIYGNLYSYYAAVVQYYFMNSKVVDFYKYLKLYCCYMYKYHLIELVL